ncbi:MAG TPA: hypothetical protein VF590_23315 [Isosphaeraceae bacterium]|jgi:anti-sigma factor RsiW
MGINSCLWVQARLPLLAGGDWLGPDRRPIERHLLLCAACRRHLAALRASQDALRVAGSSWPTPPDAPSLWPALALQIRQARRPDRRDGARTWLWPALGLAAGLLAALLIASVRPGPDPVTLAQRVPTPASAPAVVAPPPPVMPAPPDEVAAVDQTPPALEEEESDPPPPEEPGASAGAEWDEVQPSR